MSSHRTILYVEDDDTDVVLVRLALKRSGLHNPMQVVVNGVEAMDYLAGKGAFADRHAHPLPCLVLLDVKLPLRDGFQVLEWIRQQPDFASLPVILYTSSGQQADRERAQALGATDYVMKMADVKAITAWLRTRLPVH